YVLGKDYKISDQLRRLVKRKFTQEELDDLDAQQEHEPYTSDILKKFYDKNKWIENELRGATYRGRNDGYCLLRYYPIGPDVSMIAYSYAPVGDQSSQSSLGKIDWVTSSSKLRIKDIYQSTPSEKRAKQSLLDMSNYTQDSLIYASKNKMYSYITSFLKKTRDYTNKHFSYVSLLIRSTVMGNPGDSEAKMKMIDLILSYKRKFSSDDVKEILVFSMTLNKDFFREVVERLGESTNNLDINSLRDFLKHLSDEDKAFFLKTVLPYKRDLEESEVLVILESLPDDEEEIIQTLASNVGVTKFLRYLLPTIMNKVGSNIEMYVAKAVNTISFVLDSPAGREDRGYYLDYVKKYIHSKATHLAHDSIVEKLK
ncbi:MAG: hypothetical protein EB127_29200, partial [Alphaproteobacteria bacterium]|nr:hypothetical protein [Alphaproteobacteria bacterium]